MRFNINLLFNQGLCETAFTFYQSVLGGENNYGYIRYGDVPEMVEQTLSPEQAAYVFYTELAFEHFILRGQDELDGVTLSSQPNTIVNIDTEDTAEGQRIFDALSAQGESLFPLQTISPDMMYGKLIDRFGIAWEILVHTQ